MKPTNFVCISLVAACLFAFASVGHAQTDPTVSQFDKKSKLQRAPFQLAQKTDDPAKSAQKLSDPKQDPEKAIAKKPLPQVSNQRRAELMAFVKIHHAELRPLLASLQKNRPNKIQSVLRTLDREVKNLQTWEKRSPERYKKSLALWIVKSKIELLSAQLVVKKSNKARTALKNDLSNLITERHDMQVDLLTYDAELTKKRLEKLEDQLKTHRTNRGSEIQQQLTAITKNAERILAVRKREADAKKQQAKTGKQRAAAPKSKPKQQDDKTNPKDK